MDVVMYIRTMMQTIVFQLSSYETRKQRRDQRRRTAVYGTRKHATIVGGPKCIDLFVFNVDKKVEEDSIKDFLVQEENISVVNVECVSHINSYMKSFKIRVDQMYEAKLMDAKFWPEGIGCRKYVKPRYPAKNEG